MERYLAAPKDASAAASMADEQDSMMVAEKELKTAVLKAVIMVGEMAGRWVAMMALKLLVAEWAETRDTFLAVWRAVK